MLSPQRKIFLTPHNKGTAGYKFDERFCQIKQLKIISLKSAKLGVIAWLFILLLCPFLGVFSSLTMVRYFYFFESLRKQDEIFISRSLFFLAPLFLKKHTVLLHNIESIYYYEEFNSENKFFLKLIYLHQFFILKFFENFLLKNSNIVCLSKLEYRYFRLKGYAASFLKELLYSGVFNQSRKTTKNINRCFFGSFDNVRNVKMAEELLLVYPDIKFFGRFGDLLPVGLRGNYHGEISDLSDITNNYTLTILNAPRGGVQTKIIDWLEYGGKVDIPNDLKRRMGL
ncbi:hypothetical protein WNY97_14785 [Pseudoalteromonas fuliginea]|uniref:hypothetical protein n=1 Tax=Pseudoalteromonas fuliginea TaxID=1872678 RepID=UPI00316DA172